MIKPKLLTASGGDTDLYIGEKEYLEAGENFEFQVPLGIRRIHVCCIGAGAAGSAEQQYMNGGGGGALVWANNIEVEPGEKLKVTVGSPAQGYYGETGDSFISRPAETENDSDTVLVQAGGGSNNMSRGGTYFLGDGISGGGGDGGNGSPGNKSQSGGIVYGLMWGAGGGAGGYFGEGGSASAGAPDSGSGGGSAGTQFYKEGSVYQGSSIGGFGGGTGIKGRGSDGPSPGLQGPEQPVRNGNPGSGGDGSSYGGGGSQGQGAGSGAVRIIWGIRFSYPDNADIEAVE